MTKRGCSRSVWELGPIGEQGGFPDKKGRWTQQQPKTPKLKHHNPNTQVVH